MIGIRCQILDIKIPYSKSLHGLQQVRDASTGVLAALVVVIILIQIGFRALPSHFKSYEYATNPHVTSEIVVLQRSGGADDETVSLEMQR